MSAFSENEVDEMFLYIHWHCMGGEAVQQTSVLFVGTIWLHSHLSVFGIDKRI